MGVCHGKLEFQSVLRKSILSSLLQETEWESFLSICKCERFSNNKLIPLNKNNSFYIVTSGEVIAIMTTLNNSNAPLNPVTVRRYLPGDMIHLFNSSLVTSDGYIIHNRTRIEFRVDIPIKANKNDTTIINTTNHRIHTTKSQSATLVSVDSKDLLQLIKSSGGLNTLSILSSWNVVDILSKNSFCEGFTSNQLQLLGPLMQFKICFDGDVIQNSEAFYNPADNPTSSENSHRSNKSNKSSRTVNKNKQSDPAFLKNIGIILSGTGLSLTETPLEEFKEKYGMKKTDNEISIRKSTVRLSSTLKNIFNPNRQIRIQDNSISLDQLGEQIKDGYMYGLEYYFIGRDKGFHNIVAIGDCVVGLLTNETILGIKSCDHMMYRQLSYNFNRYMLSLVYEGVPILCDLTEEERVLVAKKLTYKVYQANEVIYTQGDPGDNLYIVLYGSVHESISESTRNDNPDVECDFTSGDYFGEVSMVTEAFHNGTMATKEVTAVMLISKVSFRSIFEENKSKLAEIKIKSMGEDIDLDHFLWHTKGYHLFLDFLEKEHASENIQFWYAVDRFDEMYQRLWKQYQTMESGNKTPPESTTHHMGRNSSSSIRDEEVSTRSRNALSTRINTRKTSHKLTNGSKALELAFRELHEVCGQILEKFIVDGASLQVNIPYKMRVETEHLFEEWTNHANTSSTALELLTKQSESPISINQKKYISNQATSFDINLFVKVKEIFKKPKKEVYDLLAKDTYVRLKCTDEFRDFIASIKPKDKVESKLKSGRISMISPKSFRDKNFTFKSENNE